MEEIGPDFAAYQCSDYLESSYALDGYYSKEDEWWVVIPKTQAEELIDGENDTPLGFLKVGSPGVDGVSFGYRRNEAGIWSHEPIQDEFRKIANDFNEFLQLYKSRRLRW